MSSVVASGIGHTSGPWTVGPHNRIQAGCLVLIGEREISSRPANILDSPIEEAKANARLISAAPELLEACRSIVEACERAGCDQAIPSHVASAKLAIHKATTGGQP